jgi:hypothetical protein
MASCWEDGVITAVGVDVAVGVREGRGVAVVVGVAVSVGVLVAGITVAVGLAIKLEGNPSETCARAWQASAEIIRMKKTRVRNRRVTGLRLTTTGPNRRSSGTTVPVKRWVSWRYS